jgi:AcrR family transcriptional regulator
MPKGSRSAANPPEKAKAGTLTRKRAPARARSEAARQQKLAAILDAALDVFAEHGYANTRLDEVAKRAGVAKGTIYLYAPSKEALFEALIHAGIAEPIEAAQARALALSGSAESALRMLFATLRTELLGTRRHEIARIVMTEGARFPDLAAFYHREVVSRGMGLIRAIVARGIESGEFRSDALARFPQLFVAPALVAVLWGRLFAPIEPLDIDAMFAAHLDLLMRAMKAEPK